MASLHLQLPPPPPPPNGAVLALLAALSNHSVSPNQQNTHQLALKARDDALSSSPEGYGDLCSNFCRVLACSSPELIPEAELKKFHDSDTDFFNKCCGWMGSGGSAQPNPKEQGMVLWNTLRQMAGLLLKNALVSPPLPKDTPVDTRGRVFGRLQRMELPPQYGAFESKKRKNHEG